MRREELDAIRKRVALSPDPKVRLVWLPWRRLREDVVSLLGEVHRLRAALEHYERYKTLCPCGARPEHFDTHPHVLGCPVGIAMGNTVADNYRKAVQ